MARFKNQVSKGIEQETEPVNHFLEDSNQKPKNGKKQSETRNQKPKDGKSVTVNAPDYSESDMELVNVAGFKVPYIVREYWKVECRKKRVKLSPILKAFLVDEFGLPPGFDLEDL